MGKKEFFMKNIIKKIGIIAFVAVMGLGIFTSCELPEEASLTVGDGTKTTITITGITNTYNGKFVSGGIADTVTEDMYLYLSGTITNGSVTVSILNDKGSAAVSLDGIGHVVLFISESANPSSEQLGKTYTGMASYKTITPGTNTIAFSEFVKQD